MPGIRAAESDGVIYMASIILVGSNMNGYTLILFGESGISEQQPIRSKSDEWAAAFNNLFYRTL